MKNGWKVLLSTMICLSLVIALIPSAAAATIVQGAKQVLLDENDVASGVYFEGVGEDLGLMVQGTYSEENGYQPGRCIEIYQMNASGKIVIAPAPQVSEEYGESDTTSGYYTDYIDGSRVIVDQSGQVVLTGGEKYYFSHMVDDLIWAEDNETGKEGFLNVWGTPVTAFEDGYEWISGPIRNGYCSATKYSSVSGTLYGFIDLTTGAFFGSDTWKPLSDVTAAGMVWANDGTPNAARLVTVAELKAHNVTFIPDPEYDWNYVIEEPVIPHLTQGEDQVFVIDDREDNVEKGLGSNYERFQDLYFDDVKLVGGKVSSPELSDMNWDYYAIEGSTRITVRSKVFADKPGGVHQLSATFKSLDSERETDTVKQYFEIVETKQAATPVKTPVVTPVVTADLNGLKVNDVVNFTGTAHYYTAYETHPEPCKPGLATVTRIYNKGIHNVHLIAVPGMGSNVYGWVDASAIGVTQPAQSEQPSEAVQPSATTQFAKGDKVVVKSGAKTYSGGSLAGIVYTNTYTVIQVQQDRVVIGINGVVTAAMRAEDLVAVN